jgi:circadian clock protein KaiC
VKQDQEKVQRQSETQAALLQPSLPEQERARLSTGVIGLDEILQGGFLPRRSYLVRGGPGSGKTTLGMHFLHAGLQQDERCLCITLGETGSNILKNARALGLDLTRASLLDLSPGSDFFARQQSYDIFLTAEVEREPITSQLIATVEQVRPQRVFFDSMTQMRYLSPDVAQFRKQALSCLRFLIDQGATVLFSSEGSAASPDDDLQFLSDGVLLLEKEEYNRTISVSKFRGSDFHRGVHSMKLFDQGIQVFPRLLPTKFSRPFTWETLSSGIPALDELLYGGVERGTINLITGPSGVGKTTLGLQFMKEAAGRGERSVVFTFEEWQETLLRRCEQINIPVRQMLEHGKLSVQQIEPLHYTADEFANRVRYEVETQGTGMIMIDSISGYRLSLTSGDLVSHLHALCKYLQNMGVAVLLINEVEAITGDFRATEVGVSYLADNIIFLRYLEWSGELRRAIGVLKKRLTGFERSLREIAITRYGIQVGKPLNGLQGILTGKLEGHLPADDKI